MGVTEDTVSAPTLNIFKAKLQRLYNDGSFTRFFQVCMQFPGEWELGRPNPVSYPARATGNSRSGIPGNRASSSSWREFPGISR